MTSEIFHQRWQAAHRLYELGLTVPQIAYILGITESSLRTHIHKLKNINDKWFKPRDGWIRAEITIRGLVPPDRLSDDGGGLPGFVSYKLI